MNMIEFYWKNIFKVIFIVFLFETAALFLIGPGYLYLVFCASLGSLLGLYHPFPYRCFRIKREE